MIELAVSAARAAPLPARQEQDGGAVSLNRGDDMSNNSSLIAALDAARADEVVERARNVIVKQEEIIATLRKALAARADLPADE